MARVAKTLALAVASPLLSAAADPEQLDLSLGSLGLPGGFDSRVSVGSVGMDSHAGNSYLPAPGDAPYYFMVPSQTPPRKVPGILFKIPLGIDESR